MKIIVYLLIISMVIFLLVGGFTFVITILEISTLGNRVEDSLIASGWAGFSEIDLDKIAERVDISDEEERVINLDKGQARDVVIQYVKENLKLDAALFPKDESYISHKDHPVLISEITIYNPEDLPAVCSEGASLERTTICITLEIPIDIKWLGFAYVRKHVDVDMKTFYKD